MNGLTSCSVLGFSFGSKYPGLNIVLCYLSLTLSYLSVEVEKPLHLNCPTGRTDNHISEIDKFKMFSYSACIGLMLGLPYQLTGYLLIKRYVFCFDS